MEWGYWVAGLTLDNDRVVAAQLEDRKMTATIVLAIVAALLSGGIIGMFATIVIKGRKWRGW